MEMEYPIPRIISEFIFLFEQHFENTPFSFVKIHLFELLLVLLFSKLIIIFSINGNSQYSTQQYFVSWNNNCSLKCSKLGQIYISVLGSICVISTATMHIWLGRAYIKVLHLQNNPHHILHSQQHLSFSLERFIKSTSS